MRPQNNDLLSNKQNPSDSERLAEEVLKRLIREEVEAQIRKENELVKNAAKWAYYFTAGAIAFAFLVFGFLGWRSWEDIKKETLSMVKTETEELIQQSDSEFSVKDKLTNLLNRTVVASILTQKNSSPYNPSLLKKQGLGK
jgi:hypothetical protein